MHKLLRGVVAFTVIATAQFVLGQAPPEPEFEVASIKLLPPPNPGYRINGSQTGGPGTGDPEMFRCRNCSLGSLVKQAFDLGPGQFEPPDWMWSQQFLVTAKVPPGTTKEQFHAMLRQLVKERFQLAYHFEKKEVQGYQLVTAKNGPKLKQSMEDAHAPAGATSPPVRPGIGKDGFPDRPGLFNQPIGHKLRLEKQTIGKLALALAGPAGGPVVDATGLEGTFDITLYWSSDSLRTELPVRAPSEPTVASLPEGGAAPVLANALQTQLGLRLEPKRLTVNGFVIDKIEKIPTEN